MTAPRLAALLCSLASCGSDPGLVGDIPTKPDALFGWLGESRYASWDAEGGPHATTGPHGTSVRTFFNLDLAASLQSANEVHPQGSAAVKELYDAGGIHVGWAVMVKSEDGSAAEAWYWYEVLDRESPRDRLEGQGLSLCADCHAAGTDYVHAAWP